MKAGLKILVSTLQSVPAHHFGFSPRAEVGGGDALNRQSETRRSSRKFATSQLDHGAR
jgi:hypothetical protein